MEKNKFFPKRLVFLKSDAEKTFGDLDELKKPGTIAPELSVNAKIAEADGVWGLAEDDFLKKYNDPSRIPPLGPPLAPGLTEIQLIAGKIKLIDALDGEIKTLAGEDLNEKVKDLNGPSTSVHGILQKAKDFYSGTGAEVFGSEAEKKLYEENLKKFGLKLDHKEMKKKEELAKDLPSKITEQQQKEADYQLAKLELQQLKENAKETDERYGNYNRVLFKAAKLLGIGAVGVATLASGGAVIGVLGGITATLGFVPQLDLGLFKAGNKIKQWWKESVWGIPGAEKAKKQADFKVQNIQTKLGTLQAKENLKKARIEADLKRLQDRRAAIVLEMKPVNEKLKIRKAAGATVADLGAELASLADSQQKLTEIDKGINLQEKLLKVFHLTDKHRDKISNKALLDTIAASEHLPGTGKRIKEIYEAPDKRTSDAQKEISKIKMGDISYIIEAELDIVAITDIEGFLALGFMSEDDLKIQLPNIRFLNDRKETQALYNLLVNSARLSTENPFRKEALRVIEEAKIERKSIQKAKKVLKAYTDPPGLGGMKELFEALTSNKKSAIKTKFAYFSTWGATTASPEAKLLYSFFKKTIDSGSDTPFRRAALKTIEDVLRKKGVI